MKLRDRTFEGAVRQLVRRELRGSTSRWKEYTRSRDRWTRWRRHARKGGLAYVLLCAVGLLAAAPPEYSAVALATYGLGTVLSRSQSASNRLHDPLENYFYLHHPFPDGVIFREQMWKTLRRSVWMLVVFATGLCLLFRDRLELPATWVAIAGVALAMWLACLGGVMGLVRFVPRIPSPVLLAAYLLYVPLLFWKVVPQAIVHEIQRVLAITPAGSVAFFVAQYEFHQNVVVPALVPSLAYIALLPLAFRQIERSYTAAPQLEELFGASQGSETVANGEASEEALAVERVPAVVAERLVGRMFHAPLQSEGMWLDRFIHRQLSAREEIVCRFLSGGSGTNWTRSWIRGSKLAVIPLIVAAIPMGAPAWMVWLPGAVAIVSALPLLGGDWAGFADVFASGKLSPFYATFPVGFRETARVLLKANVLRTLAWAPGVALVFLCIGRVLSVSAGTSIMWALEFLAVAICLQPLAVIGKFSKGSNDSRSWDWRKLLLLPGVIALLIAFVLFAAGLLVAGIPAKLGCAAGMALTSTLVLVVYRFGYERCYWDLLHEPSG